SWQALRTVAERSAGGSQGAVADRLLRRQRTPRARPCRPARALRRGPVRLPHAQGNGTQDLPRLSQTDRHEARRARVVRRQILRGRSLRFRVLHLGRAPRAAHGRAQALHRVQGPHGGAPRDQTRGRGREGQGLRPFSALTVMAGLVTASRVYPTCGTYQYETRASPSFDAIHVFYSGRTDCPGDQPSNVSYFTFVPARHPYAGEVTERSVMMVGV